jgi:hypothetical protein
MEDTVVGFYPSVQKKYQLDWGVRYRVSGPERIRILQTGIPMPFRNQELKKFKRKEMSGPL